VLSEKGMEQCRKQTNDTFGFFENRSPYLQSVQLNMPVREGTAYFEVLISTTSTKDSYLQIGAVVASSSVHIQHCPLSAISTPGVCLGVGSSKGSYAVDGIDDPAYPSMRWVDGTSKQHGKMTFKSGTVVGVLLDVQNKRISYFLNGDFVGPIINQDPKVSWAEGLCPAFSFLPGQAFMLNVGQKPFIHGQEYQSVLSAYFPTPDNGICRVYDEDWLQWVGTDVGEIIYENPRDEIVRQYCNTLRYVLNQSTRDDSLDVSVGLPSQSCETTIPSRVELLMKFASSALPVFKLLPRDVALSRLKSFQIGYPEVRSTEDEYIIGSLKQLQPSRGSSEVSIWLRRPEEEIGLDMTSRLLDEAVVRVVSKSNMAAIFYNMTANRANSRKSKDLFVGRVVKVQKSENLADTQTPEGNGETEGIQLKSFSGRNSVPAGRGSMGLSMSRLTVALSDINVFDLNPTTTKTMSAQTVDIYLASESEVNRISYLKSLVRTAFCGSSRRSEVAHLTARTLRTLAFSVSPGEFESPDEAARALDEQNKYKYERKVDEYVTADEQFTLKAVQDTLTSLGAVPLACYLMSQVDNESLQQEGIELGIFLLELLNKKSQEDFIDVLDRKVTDAPEDIGESCAGFMTSLAETLSRFESNVGGRWGIERLKGLANTTRLLSFLQSLCDGQNISAQDQMVSTTASNGESLVVIIVRILGYVYSDIQTMGVGAIQNNPNELQYLLELAQQILDTLVDSVQGPHLEIQDVMLESGLFTTLQSVFDIVFMLRIAVIRSIEQKNLLPSVDVLTSKLLPDRLKVAQCRKDLPNSVFSEILVSLNDVEKSALEMIRSSAELGAYDDAKSATLANISKYQSILNSFKMDSLIERFKVCWASVVFDPARQLQPYLRKYRAGGYDKSSQSQESEIRESFSKQFKRIMSILRDDTNMSFTPGNIMLGSPEEDKQLFFRLWSLRNKTQVEEDIELAFAHYRNITMVCDNLLDEGFMKSCGDETKTKLHELQDLWNPAISKSSLVSADEAMGFDSYFASIEIIRNRSQLQRIYFPIPADCREQMKNRLVLSEMQNLTDNVKRDSPEKKLDDFLDRSLQVRDVIQQQQYILETSKFRGVFRFVAKFESTFVTITFLLTSYINISLLLNASNHHSKDNFYLPSSIKSALHAAGGIHMILSFILLFNFLMGTALVNINSGFKWKQNVSDGIIALDFLEGIVGNGADAIFEILNALLPKFVWAGFFLATDMKTIYYIAFVLFSVFGFAINPAFFCFHVLDIVMRIPILGYVIQSVTMNIGQVAVTFLLGAVFMWIYAVIAVYNFGYNQYNYGDSPDFEWPSSLASTYWQHLDFGLRGPPIFASYEDDATAKYLFDISYQIFIIVIMVAIITGIIIDTFSDLRAARGEVEDDQENVCFICGLEREVFERNRIKFAEHKDMEHNPWHYLYYQMYLFQKKSSELNALERKLLELMRKQSIEYFPLNKAMCLPQSEQDEEVSDKIDHLKGDIYTLEGKIQQVQDHLLSVSSSIAEIATSMKSMTGGPDSPEESKPTSTPNPPNNT